MHGSSHLLALGGVEKDASGDSVIITGTISFSWEVPVDVFSISAAGIEQGSTLTRTTYYSASPGTLCSYGYAGAYARIQAGKGPDLMWKNEIAVTPGETLTVRPNEAKILRGTTVLLGPSVYDDIRVGASAVDTTITGTGAYVLAVTSSTADNLSGSGFRLPVEAGTSGVWGADGTPWSYGLDYANTTMLSLSIGGEQLFGVGGSGTKYGQTPRLGRVTPSSAMRLPNYAYVYGGTTYYIPENNYVTSRAAGNGAVRIVWPGAIRKFPSQNVGSV